MVSPLIPSMRNYTDGDVLLILKMLQHEQIGRKKLSSILGLGEATIRTVFRTMESEKLIISTKKGQKITEKGEKYLKNAPHFTFPRKVEGGTLTLSQYNVASLISAFSHRIKNGLHIRDAAIMAGAEGATTVIFSDSEFRFPQSTKLPPEISHSFVEEFSPREGDVLIVATAKTAQKAMRGISGCLGLLLSDKEL